MLMFTYGFLPQEKQDNSDEAIPLATVSHIFFRIIECVSK